MDFDNYPGAKNNSGIIQFLINRIPYHTRYFELYAGTAALFYAKRPAAISNVITDADMRVVKEHWEIANPICDCYRFEALDYINSGKVTFTRSDFIYLDPPYPMDSRRQGKLYYKFEMSDDDHIQLLKTVLQTDANIMISTRENELYAKMLKSWRKDKFSTVDRAGAVDEIIYMNYKQPALLHQYNYLGNDCWDRQGVKRKVQRFEKKIQQLPAYERHLLIQELIKHNVKEVEHFMMDRHELYR